MKNKLNKLFVAILTILLLAAVVAAIDFIPRGDINMKDLWNIKNALWINGTNANFSENVTASYFIGDGSELTGLVNVSSATVNHSNSTDFWDGLDDPTDITSMGTFTGVNITASHFIGDGSGLTGLVNVSSANVNHSNSTDYWDDLGSPSDITTLGALTSLDCNGAADFASIVTIHDNVDMSSKNITNIDWLFVHNISGYSPVQFNSNIVMTAYNITASLFKGLIDWSNITNAPTNLSEFTNDLDIATNSTISAVINYSVPVGGLIEIIKGSTTLRDCSVSSSNTSVTSTSDCSMTGLSGHLLISNETTMTDDFTIASGAVGPRINLTMSNASGLLVDDIDITACKVSSSENYGTTVYFYYTDGTSGNTGNIVRVIGGQLCPTTFMNTFTNPNPEKEVQYIQPRRTQGAGSVTYSNLVFNTDYEDYVGTVYNDSMFNLLSGGNLAVNIEFLIDGFKKPETNWQPADGSLVDDAASIYNGTGYTKDGTDTSVYYWRIK